MIRVFKVLVLAVILTASAASAACNKNEACKDDSCAPHIIVNNFTGPSPTGTPTGNSTASNLSVKLQMWGTNNGGAVTTMLGEVPCENAGSATFAQRFNRNTNYKMRLTAQGNGRGSIDLQPTTNGPILIPGTGTCNSVNGTLSDGLSCEAAFNTRAGGAVTLKGYAIAYNDGSSKSCTAVVNVQ